MKKHASKRGALGSLVARVVAPVWAQRRDARERAALAATAVYFDRNGQKIRYRLEGREHAGPTVVMLSGFVGALEQWDVAQRALQAFAPVLTYDRGGYALSDAPPGYDADAQADELADLAAAEGVKLPLIVVGFSSSSLVARAFVKRHPNLLGGLLLLDPTNPEQIVDVPLRDLYARRVLYERVPLYLGLKRLLGVRVSFPPGEVAPTPAAEHAVQILNFPGHWWTAFREGAVIGRSARQAQLDWSKVKAPVTLLSVAHSDGTHEVKERFRLYQEFVVTAGAKFINPSGFRHDQVDADPTFLPYIVDAIRDLIAQARAAAPRQQ